MHFSKILYNKFLYIELYRYADSYVTGVSFSMRPWEISFSIYILGLTFIIQFGKDLLE